MNKILITIVVVMLSHSCQSASNKKGEISTTHQDSVVENVSKKEAEIPIDSNTKHHDIRMFLKHGDLKKISDKKEVNVGGGCIVTSTTQGTLELEKIFNNSTYFKSLGDKKIFCIALIENKDLYHLHDLAGECLSKLLEKEDIVDFVKKNVNKTLIGYCLIRINHPMSSVMFPGGDFVELSEKEQAGIFAYLKNKYLDNSSKLYLIDGIYSLVFKKETIKNIHSEISLANIDKSLLEYNNSLFNKYKDLKAKFEDLDKIRTWMEMDKNYDNIKTMLINCHPAMFLQVLSFNPSTLLESTELCKLKEEKLIEIIENADKNSYYKHMKYTYMNELLIENNYTVRFLDRVIKKKSINKYRDEVEKM